MKTLNDRICDQMIFTLNQNANAAVTAAKVAIELNVSAQQVEQAMDLYMENLGIYAGSLIHKVRNSDGSDIRYKFV